MLTVSRHSYQGWLSNPYLMTEAISRPGGAKMTGRPNIQRKHTTSGTGRK
jgi:hypothetical protein